MGSFHKVSVALAACAIMYGAPAQAEGPMPAQGLFGSLTGAYIVDAGKDNWQLFGPAVATTSKTSAGDGAMVQGVLGYRWGMWDAALGLQYMDLSRGKTAATGAGSLRNRLSADMWAVDGMIGYLSMFENASVRTAFGLRYAQWNTRAHFLAGATISHDWSGIGPRGSVSGKLPLGDGFSLFGEGAVAVLFGRTKTSATVTWSCAGCNNHNATSLNAEGKLGLGWAVKPGVDLILGYQLQYWGDVNVAITDNTGTGGNQGKSSYLTHGPYATISFALGGK